MKKFYLSAALALLLASCGGPSTPTQPSKTTPGTQQPAPAPGPVADLPTDSTAAREFIVTGRKLSTLGLKSSSLTAQELHPLADIDLGQRLRVVLTVNRAKSGASLGQKKASVVFIWGNEAVNLGGTYTLGLGETGAAGTVKSTDGKLALSVKSPDFQAKGSRSTSYAPDSGQLCARLTFNLSAGAASWASNTPLEVCEGPAERAAEQVALEKFSKPMPYSMGSDGIAPWKFQRLSSTPTSTMPTSAQVLTALNLPPSAPVVQVTTLSFIQALYQHINAVKQGSSPEKNRALTALNTLYAQFGIYYTESRVYKIQATPDRQIIYILGRNSYGLAGLTAFRFATSGLPDPTYAAANVYPSFYTYGGSLIGELQIGPHTAGAVVSGVYGLRESNTCSAGGAGVVLDKALNLSFVFPSESNGQTSTAFEIEATPDPVRSMVLDYEITIAYQGQNKKYPGFVCYTYTPPATGGPASLAVSELDASFGVFPDGFNVSEVAMSLPIGSDVSGSFVVQDLAQCGGSGSNIYAEGAYRVEGSEYAPPYMQFLMAEVALGPRFRVPVSAGAGAGMVYDITATFNGTSRRWQGVSCWQELTLPDDGGGIGMT